MLPKELVAARKYLMAAERAIDMLYGADETGSLSLTEARSNIKRGRVWLDEYTDCVADDLNGLVKPST